MLSDTQNKSYCWYPDEEICRRRKGVPDWVRQQRKIVKARPENCDFYFLLEMLKVPFRVTSRVKGLDPDQPLAKEPQQLKAWHKRNKGTTARKLSAEHRAKLKMAAERARLAKLEKRQLMMDENENPESDMLSQLTSMEDLKMRNQTTRLSGQEVC
jgi:hypothetical protein